MLGRVSAHFFLGASHLIDFRPPNDNTHARVNTVYDHMPILVTAREPLLQLK